MEKGSKGKLLEETVESTKMKSESTADVPADEIEDDKDVETQPETDSDSDSDSSSDSDSDFECEVCNKKFSSYMNLRQHNKGKKHAKAVLRKKKEKKLMKIDTVSESDEEVLDQEPYAECKICKKEFSGPEGYEKHLKCKKHKQKVLKASILEQVQEEGKINPDKLRDLYKNKRKVNDNADDTNEKITSLTLDDDEEENEEEEFECEECEKLFSGFIPYAQHLTSKSHAKKIEKKNLLHKVIPKTCKKDHISEESKEDDIGALSMEDGVLVCKVCSTSFSGPENAMTHRKSKKHAKSLEKYLRKLEKKKVKKVTKNKDKEEDNKPENENEDEATKDNIKPISERSGVSDIPENKTVKPSTSDNRANESLIAHEKYKEYKKLMNSLREEDALH